LSQKVLPFSPLLKLKKDQKFVWGDEQEKAFDEIKRYMKEPPVLVPPQLNKPFKLYVADDTQTIGSTLIQEFEGKKRVVVYLSRRIGKWILVLSEFELKFESAKAIKGQIIADFITEHRDPSIDLLEITPWTLFFDGSSCGKGGGVGILLISPRGEMFEFAIPIQPTVTTIKLSTRRYLEGFNT
jgi:hypothetical protein